MRSKPLSRRAFGRALGATLAAPWVGGAVLPGCQLVWDSALAVPAELRALVDALEAAPTRRAAVEAAGDHLRGGGTLDELAIATQLACCRQLSYDVLGFTVHPLWTIGSVRDMGAWGTPRDAVVGMLHAVELYKLEHKLLRGDTRIGPGELGDLPTGEPAALSDLLDDAVGSGDPDGADHAAAALFATGDRTALGDAVARASLRDVGSIGHVQVHASQVIRTSEGVGWTESVARTVAWAMGQAIVGEAGRPGSWEGNVTRAAALPDTWDGGTPDPGSARALVVALRTQDADVASEAVAAALTDGLAVDSVLDALFARASELSLGHSGRAGAFPGLHTTTGLEGFRWILANRGDDALRRLAILQAGALVAFNDAEAEARSGDRGLDVRLDEIAPVSGATPAEILETASSDRLEATAALLGLGDDAALDEFLDAQRVLALRTGVDDHNFKLPVAARLAAGGADPSFVRWVLASTLGWGNVARDPDWDQLDVAEAIADEVA